MAAPQIYAGLLDRGLPPYIAEAFMDSFMAESGLNPTINEISPLIAGSRGGRGLYQLTGPRRKAYEAKYGDDYDIDSQLDFLMYELQGPEARAADAIFATDNRADAVRAITSKFLRPYKDNSEARIGMWGGAMDMPANAPGHLGPRTRSGLGDEQPPQQEPSWFDETALGRFRSEKIRPAQERTRTALGLDAKGAKNFGNALQSLGLNMMQGGL